MKRILAIALVLLLCGAALAEETGFVFRNGVTWGMTEDEVLATEGGAEYEHTDMGDGLTRIEIDDDEAFGAEDDVNYIFLNGALVMNGYEFDAEDISAEDLTASLTGEYGEPDAADIPRLLTVMEALYDSTPPDLPEGAVFVNWTLADGTYVVLTTGWDDDMDELSLAYIDEQTILANRSVSEPAPALAPDGE